MNKQWVLKNFFQIQLDQPADILMGDAIKKNRNSKKKHKVGKMTTKTLWTTTFIRVKDN